MIEIAIIGPTASGKSDLALELAEILDGYILSIDSLSVYKEIDIASAKPDKSELQRIKHFGIDEIYPNEHFNAAMFIDLYQKAKIEAFNDKKALILVGGSSFYLKSLLDGLSIEPNYSKEVVKKADELVANLSSAYDYLLEIDPVFVSKITKNDKYRIKKGIMIYLQTGFSPTRYFELNKKEGLKKEIPIFEIELDRQNLRQKINKRTEKMLKSGLIDEVCFLEKKYTREPKCMKAIGINEVLDYLDGKLKKDELKDAISTHTSQLAKRQQIFNKTQFNGIFRGDVKSIKERVLKMGISFLSS